MLYIKTRIDKLLQNYILMMKRKKNRPYLVAAAIILLIIEIVFLYFALQMAMSYAKNTTELVIHLLLATFLTIPYVFVNATFNTDVYKSFSRNK